MKFELFLFAATLYICGAKWCSKIKLDKALLHEPSLSDPLEIVPRNTTTTKQVWVCCEGYDLTGKECAPRCEHSCPETQKCVEPDVCGCDAGHYLKDDKCHPDCENCENGRCSEPGVCLCNPGYARIGDKCEPRCERNCINGFCKSPNKCACNKGYQESPETGECEPECEPGCVANAYCTPSGVCQCKVGFYRNAANLCQSWCTTQCKNGECVGPNKCDCHQGFVKVDGMCIRDCNFGCRFGDCMNEQMCVCWPGYVYNYKTGNCEEGELTNASTTTQPTPRKLAAESCPEYCPTGICVDGTCQCAEGFVRANMTCAANCEHCQYGECVEKRVCEGLSKVLMELSSFTSTDPSSTEETASTSSESPLETSTEQGSACARGCWAGTCVDGVCQCTDGLVLSAENDCVRPCEVRCKHGCTQDGLCVCPLGSVLKNDLDCVPVCKEGYIYSTGPNQEDICTPTCDGLEGNEGCLNGTCVGVNKCECQEGLIFNPVNRFECIPYPADVAERHHQRSWYIYLLLGLLTVLVMIILLLLALRKFHQDTYNVEKVEKRRRTVQYHEGQQGFCEV